MELLLGDVYKRQSRHIVYAGGVEKYGKTPKDTRTGWQKKALEKYVKDFHRKFPDVRIVGPVSYTHLDNEPVPVFILCRENGRTVVFRP